MAQEKKEYIENRQIRIFISSTFKDMQAEREYLVTKVFPGLRKYCEERDVSLFELDLRWGITQEDSENQRAFKICLDEVNKTKPFFIGLLGERYGWIPSEDDIKKMDETGVFDEYKWIQSEFKRKISITEAEILAGALLLKEDANAYFYIRSPKMEIPNTNEFKDKSGSHEEKMLIDLKDKIKNNKKYPLKDYDNIEHLGELVEKDFKELVNIMFPEEEHLSDFEKESMQQKIFFNTMTKVYVENKSLYNTLDRFVDSDDEAIIVTGERGIGKSALLANWIKYRQNKNIENVKIVYHFIGISQSEGDYKKISQRLVYEITKMFNYNKNTGKLTVTTSKGEINKKKNQINKNLVFIEKLQLEIISFFFEENEKLIIILDCLDRLLESEKAKYLDWLPKNKNIKIIYSAPTHDKSIKVLELTKYNQILIEAPSIEIRKKIITEYFALYSKKLQSTHIENIISSKFSENPLVLLSILNNIRIFGDFANLDKQINEYLVQDNMEKVYNLILENIEKLFSNININLIKDLLSFIFISRNGLTENEIINISKIPRLYWSQLLNIMSDHLLLINGCVKISNNKMKNAIKERYLIDDENEKYYRNEIVYYYENNNDVSIIRKYDELPYHLLKLNEWDKLFNFLIDFNVFMYIYKKNEMEICNYWFSLKQKDENRYMMEKYNDIELSIIENIDIYDYKDFKYFCFSLYVNVNRELAKNNLEKNKNYLAISLYNLADFQTNINDYKNAEINYNEAIDVFRKLKKTNTNNYIEDLATSICSLACLKIKTNCFEEAKTKFDEAKYMLWNLYEKEPEKFNPDLVIMLFIGLTDLQYKTKSYKEAESNCNKALFVLKNLFDNNINKYLIDKAKLLNNLAYIKSETNRYEEAIVNYTEALKILKMLSGENPEVYLIDYSSTLMNLADLQIKINFIDDAENKYTEALENYRKLEENEPDEYINEIVKLLHIISKMRMESNRNLEAEVGYLELLDIHRRLAKFHTDHLLSLVYTLNKLNIIQLKMNKHDEAEINYKEALDISRIYLEIEPDKNTRNFAEIIYNLADIEFNSNRYTEAEKNYNEALELFKILSEKNYNEYIKFIINILGRLSEIKFNKNRLLEAEDNLNELLIIYRKLSDINTEEGLFYVIDTLNNLGVLQTKRKGYDEAEINFSEALLINRKMIENNPDTYLPQLVSTLKNTAYFYKETNRIVELENIKNEINKIQKSEFN